MGTVTPQKGDENSGAPVRSRFFVRNAALRSPGDALQPEAAPPPPAKQTRGRKRSLLSAISGFFTFLMIAGVAGVIGLVVAGQRLAAPGPLKTDKVVFIPPRTDYLDILNRLENEGVIESQFMMNMALVAQGNRSNLKAGEYSFKQSASLQDVMDTLVSGRSELHSLTIPEGLTSEQIVGRLREQELLENEIKDIPKEGTLMPDTYKFSRGEARDKQIKRMADAQKKVLAEIWARRVDGLPIKSPDELVTLASIVERETGKADERARVAGVFINRLNKNMPLQSDPTIVYGLVGGKGTLGHAITREELTKSTRYNTYQIRGLPPGPIGNPGRAAMEAVANPSRTQELFFVADGTGGHVFAETLDQHNKNVVRWRQIERDAKDKLAPDAEKPLLPSKPGDQKGDLDAPLLLPVFAPTAFAASEPPAAVAAEAIARLAAAMQNLAAPSINRRVAESRVALRQPTLLAAAPKHALNFGSFDQLSSARIAGDTSAEDLDAPVDLELYPVSSTRRAEQKSRAARFGLVSGVDIPVNAPAQPILALPNPPVQTGARPKAFDASEGTSIDPLKNKSFDLNSAKIVPSFR